MNTKKELFGIELQAYLNASKKEKGKILDSLSRQTGMWRESIMRSFKRLQMESAYFPKKKRGRSVYYTPDVSAGLKEIWEAANSCCGELLHPVISEYVLIFKRDKTWKHNDEATDKLLAMSLATVKRKVNGWQCESGRKGISTTTPSAIKERVPIFQGSWHQVSPGMGQIDTVAHCGGSLSGDFIYSCGYVDVSSGWFHYTAQWNKGMEATKESLKHIQKQLPFPLCHIHPDCGMEFLNQIVMGWCEDEKIEVSRSRSYHKNDNGYIEQRNGHIARRWLGYDRLSNKDLLPKIIKFYDLVCEYHNHFIAQRLCVGTKLMSNGKHRKVYEKNGMTPFTRLCANEKISKEIKEKLKTEHEKLNPKILRDKLLKIKYDILQTNRRTTERS
ncbi:MAG: hypothetical protein AAB889_00290 [Patescibacteria group bacterium]